MESNLAKFLSKVPTVKVGAHTIKVNLVPRPEGTDPKTMGEAFYDKQTIDLYKESVSVAPASMVLELLIHEILHHMFWSRPGLIKTQKQEELVVDALGKSVTELLLCNPQLLEAVKHVAQGKG